MTKRPVPASVSSCGATHRNVWFSYVPAAGEEGERARESGGHRARGRAARALRCEAGRLGRQWLAGLEKAIDGCIENRSQALRRSSPDSAVIGFDRSPAHLAVRLQGSALERRTSSPASSRTAALAQPGGERLAPSSQTSQAEKTRGVSKLWSDLLCFSLIHFLLVQLSP